MLLLIVSVLVLALALAFIAAQRKPPNTPPGPWRLPLLGNFLDMGLQPHVTLPAMAKKYGGMYSLMMGKHFAVVLADYESLIEVLKRKGTKAGGRTDWMTQLDIVSGHWKDMVAAGTIDGYVLHSSVDSTRTRSFDASSGAFHNFPNNSRELAHLVGNPVPSDFIPLLKIFPKPSFLKRLQQLVDENISLMRNEIAHHKKTMDKERPRDLLDLTIIARDQDETKGESYTDEHLAYILQDLFVAGTDTTSATVEWFMAIMVNHPHVLAKMQAEIDSVVGKRPVQWDDHASLPWTNAVIKETLRFRAVAQFFTHQITEDMNVTYKGKEYTIPKDTVIWPMFGSVHMSHEKWDKPEQFNPDRFVGLSPKEEADLFVGFGLGIRQCLGINLAQMEMFLIIAQLVQQFSWSAPPGETISLEGDLTILYTAKPYKVVLSKRL